MADGTTLNFDANQEAATRFVDGLAELTRETGIAVSGDPTLFIADAEERYTGYRIDADSRLQLG